MPLSPVSPVLVPSPPRYDYEFGAQQSALGQQWNGSNGERRGMDIYSAGSALAYPSTYGSAPASMMESSYLTSDDMGGLGILSSTPPTSSFPAPGLPFRGLDYIRNYNSDIYPTNGDQDPLWQTFDPGAFGYDPDLPFVLGDLSIDLTDGSR